MANEEEQRQRIADEIGIDLSDPLLLDSAEEEALRSPTKQAKRIGEWIEKVSKPRKSLKPQAYSLLVVPKLKEASKILTPKHLTDWLVNPLIELMEELNLEAYPNDTTIQTFRLAHLRRPYVVYFYFDLVVRTYATDKTILTKKNLIGFLQHLMRENQIGFHLFDKDKAEYILDTTYARLGIPYTKLQF